MFTLKTGFLLILSQAGILYIEFMSLLQKTNKQKNTTKQT